MAHGIVVSIHITPAARGEMISIPQARAVPGRGLEGDRYFLREGSFSRTLNPDRQLTLIEIEAIEGLAAEHGIEIRAQDSRRNVATRGVRLNDLVDREFQVGAARLRGIKLCEPCKHMADLIGKPGVLRALVHRGGLRAEILSEGVLRVGDAVVVD